MRVNAGRLAEEPAERRPETQGNADQQSTHRTQSRVRVTQALDRVREAARRRKKGQFTALLHHIDADTLRTAFYALKRKAAPGVDGITWHDYEADLEPRIDDLHGRVHRGAYRPQPSRRTYIPKADGRQRPLAIAALEDKIVQGATVMALNAIYEGDFCGFSYGFRPGRGPHDALDALSTAIKIRKVNWILDADIQNFFGAVSQSWLVRFLEHRVSDKRIIRLIQKWLKAGILEDGIVTVDDRGTGQGLVISPLLANIYLHYCFDLWAERWRRQEAHGDMIVVRYADDLVIGFERESDAHRFLDAMRERLGEFALSLHPDKTRLIEFGRFAAVDRKRRDSRRDVRNADAYEAAGPRRPDELAEQALRIADVLDHLEAADRVVKCGALGKMLYERLLAVVANRSVERKIRVDPSIFGVRDEIPEPAEAAADVQNPRARRDAFGGDPPFLARRIGRQEALLLHPIEKSRVELGVADDGRIEKIEPGRRLPQSEPRKPVEAGPDIDPEFDTPKVGQEPGCDPLHPPDRRLTGHRAKRDSLDRCRGFHTSLRMFRQPSTATPSGSGRRLRGQCRNIPAPTAWRPSAPAGRPPRGAAQPISKSHSERQRQRFAGFLNDAGSK